MSKKCDCGRKAIRDGLCVKCLAYFMFDAYQAEQKARKEKK